MLWKPYYWFTVDLSIYKEESHALIIVSYFYNIILFRTLSKSLLTFNREKDWKEVGNPLVTLFFFNLLYPRTTYWNTSCGEFCMIRHIKDASFTRDFSIGFAISTILTNNNCVGWCHVHICKQLLDLYNQNYISLFVIKLNSFWDVRIS